MEWYIFYPHQTQRQVKLYPWLSYSPRHKAHITEERYIAPNRWSVLVSHLFYYRQVGTHLGSSTLNGHTPALKYNLVSLLAYLKPKLHMYVASYINQEKNTKERTNTAIVTFTSTVSFSPSCQTYPMVIKPRARWASRTSQCLCRYWVLRRGIWKAAASSVTHSPINIENRSSAVCCLHLPC